jgi:hypothetical protein
MNNYKELALLWRQAYIYLENYHDDKSLLDDQSYDSHCIIDLDSKAAESKDKMELSLKRAEEMHKKLMGVSV